MQPEVVSPTGTSAGAASVWVVDRLARSLGEHARDWDALNESILGGHPLLTSTFVNGLLGCFGDDSQHLCRLVDEQSRLVGACILQRGRLGVWRSFLPAQAQIGPTLLSSLDEIRALFTALPGLAQAIELLCLDASLPPLGRPLPGRVQVMHHTATISVDLQGSFDGFWGTRPKKLRENLRRYQRLLDDAMPGVQVQLVREPNAVRIAVHSYAELEGRGWKGLEGTALGSTPEQLRFYEELMVIEAEAGRAFALELRQGPRLLASRLLLSGPTMVVTLKTTYDEALRRFAVGRILLKSLLEHLFEHHQGRSLEFYTNATSEQLRWAQHERSVVHATLYRDRLRSVAASLRARIVAERRRADPAPALEGLVSTEVRWVTSSQQLQPCERALLDAGETESFLGGSGWFDLFERTVMKQSDGACYATLARGGLVKAVLPLNRDPPLLRTGGSIGSLANWYSTRWLPGLAPGTIGADLVDLVEQLRVGLGRPPRLTFAPLLAGSRELAVLHDALVAGGYRVERYVAHGNWHLPVVTDWTSYLASRNGPLRSTIKRMTRQCLERGGRIEVIYDGARLEAGIEAYQAVYARSWKQAEPQQDFMPEMMRWCASRGWLRLGVLWSGEKPVAAQVWVVAHGRASIYKIAYDEAHAASRPGTVLTAHLMKLAIEEDRVHEVDYLTGDDNYKRDWMSHRRELHGLVAYDIRQWRGWWLWFRARASTSWRAWRTRLSSARGAPVTARDRASAASAAAPEGATPAAPHRPTPGA
ncbi:MAG: GNAT family N-acetyltransferase [Burkholderiaceae bacterium]|nr:GNAT family N-acetyltransferase [Burkholderiaceae bacterium]